jgi:hypothetical protein
MLLRGEIEEVDTKFTVDKRKKMKKIEWSLASNQR